MPRLMDDDEWRRTRALSGARGHEGQAHAILDLTSLAAEPPAAAEGRGVGSAAAGPALTDTFLDRIIAEGTPGDAVPAAPAVHRVRGAGGGVGDGDAGDHSFDIASTVSDLVHKGNAALKAGRLHEAAKLYSAGLELNPMHAVLYNNRSACYLQQGSLAEALADAEACISIEPTFYKGWLRKGNALYALHDLEGSLAAIQKGIWLEPTSPELLTAMDAIVVAINERCSSKFQQSVGAVPDQDDFTRPGSPPPVVERSPTGSQDRICVDATVPDKGQMPAESIAVMLELKLDLDFEVTGLPGTPERAEFSVDLQNDLSQASWEPSSRFLIKSVSPDVTVEVQVLEPPLPGGRDTMSVVAELEIQATDPTSRLFLGPATCHTQSLKRRESRELLPSVDRVENTVRESNQHKEQISNAGENTPERSANETRLNVGERMLSRSSIPWASSLIGCAIPAEWKEGSEFSTCSTDDNVRPASDELIILVPSFTCKQSDTLEQFPDQYGQAMQPNRFALVTQVHADSSLTVLIDMYQNAYKLVSASEIRRINPYLLDWLYAEGRAHNPAGTDEPVMCLSSTTLRDLGNEAYLAVQFESAVHFFSAGLVLNPNDTVLLNNRSKTLFDLGDLKRSLMDAELCIALRPDWFRGWLRAALALSKLNMHSAAHTCINEAIEIDAALSPRKENSELQDALDIIREQQAMYPETGYRGIVRAAGTRQYPACPGVQVTEGPPYLVVGTHDLRTVQKGQESVQDKQVVMRGDRLIAVDGCNVENVSAQQFDDQWGGEVGSVVELTLMHSHNNEQYEVSAVRDVCTPSKTRGSTNGSKSFDFESSEAHYHGQVSESKSSRPSPWSHAYCPTPTTNGNRDSLLRDDSLDATVSKVGAAATGCKTSTSPPAVSNVQEQTETSPPDFGNFSKTSALLENAAEQARMKFDSMFNMPNDGLRPVGVYASHTTYYSSDEENGDRAIEVDDFSEEC